MYTMPCMALGKKVIIADKQDPAILIYHIIQRTSAIIKYTRCMIVRQKKVLPLNYLSTWLYIHVDDKLP